MTKRMPGFFDVEERLRELSAKGDDLERVKALVDFEIFRPALEAAVSRARREDVRPSIMFSCLKF
jgi:IS5 family transposase